MTEKQPPDTRWIDVAQLVYERVMTELRSHMPEGVSQQAHSNLEKAWMERNEECNQLRRVNEALQEQVDELQKMADSRSRLLENFDREYQALRHQFDPAKRRLEAVRRAVDPAVEAPR